MMLAKRYEKRKNMELCNICGGLKATENLEMIAGTICKCLVEPEVINFLPDNSKQIKLCYGIGKYTNANKPAIRHIADNNNKPLCGSRKKFTYETENGERAGITCKKCRQKYL